MTERPAFPAAFLNEAGLNRQHVFEIADLPADIRQTIAPSAEEKQLILLGHGGRRLWEKVSAAGLPGEHPIDDYTRLTVARWFAEFMPTQRYRILYPDPGPTPIGLQALGALAGWHHASPLMLGIDPQWGSWFAYRAVVVADSGFLPFFPVDPEASRGFYGRSLQDIHPEESNPCRSCHAAPCISHCPATALSPQGMALSACVDYRRQADSACRETCLARLACPVGADHRYNEAQLRHTYSRSLKMIEQYCSAPPQDG